MRAVAVELCGEVNKQLSSEKELRFGKHGSLSVDLEKGTFYDHQETVGGGVLDLIARFTSRSGAQAVEWLREKGFDIEDDRPPPPPRQQSNGPRLDPAGNWLPNRVPDHGRLTKTYDYTDAAGRLAYQVCRYEWTVDQSVNAKGHEKTFVQRTPDAKKQGGWNYSTKGVTWLPYRLPELLDDIRQGFPVFIVEGEKKVDLLREQGVPATCNHGGAGKFPEDLVQHFAGADLILLPDNDDAGRQHMDLVARRLEGTARRIRKLDLPGLPPKGGVDDWLPNGGSAEALYDLVDAMAAPFEASPYVSQFGAVEWMDFDNPGPSYDYLVKGVLTRGEQSMLLGESQSGKSFLAIDVAMAVARGVEWFGHKVRRGGVIYQAGESAVGVRRRRFPAYRRFYDCGSIPLPVVLLERPVDFYTSDEQVDAFIDECRYWGRRFEGTGAPLELIVIDTFNKATPGANENDGKDMGLVLARCDRIRRETGAHVMLVHHLNAGGTKARGHTSLFANVENVITVQRVPDSHDNENRQVRSWKVAKQKDGEDGKETKFVLKGVEIGVDGDGDKVFSCVVAEPDRGTGEQKREEAGLTVGGANSVLLRAIYTAIAQRGVYAPPECGLGTGAQAVERKALWEFVRPAFETDTEDDGLRDGETPEDAKKRRDAAMRQAVKRARDFLFSKGIIGFKDEWTWLTGKNVKGFEQAPGLADAERERRSRRRARQDDTGPSSVPPDLPPEADLPFRVEDFE